jgi:hypothetical protein
MTMPTKSEDLPNEMAPALPYVAKNIDCYSISCICIYRDN